MKHIVLSIALGGLLHSAQAQSGRRPLPLPLPIDSISQQISYRGTVATPGLPAAEVFGRTQEWLAGQFEDYRSVVQLADAGRGVLMGRALVRAHVPTQQYQANRDFNLLFRFHFRVLNGALHYELTDISYPNYPVTSAAADAASGLAADALVSWTRHNEFSRLGTTAAQTHRLPVEPILRANDQYTEKGAPKPRLLQQCQGIDEAMTTLLASLSRELSSPRL